MTREQKERRFAEDLPIIKEKAPLLNSGDNMLAFDMDGTTTETTQPLTPDVAQKIINFIKSGHIICPITAQSWKKFKKQFIDPIGAIDDSVFSNVYAYLEQGCQPYRYVGGKWEKFGQSKELSDEQRKHIAEVVLQAAKNLGLLFRNPQGEIVDFRKGLVTISFMGNKIDQRIKKFFDPDNTIRRRIIDEIRRIDPTIIASIGGQTSIDATLEGFDKAYAISQMTQHFGIEEKNIVYIGDETDKYGNDYPIVKNTDAIVITVPGPEGFCRIIDITMAAAA